MSKITTLEIIQNLRQEGLDLGNLSEQQIIRIEKTLKAKIKLDKSLDINDLEAITHMLRTQADNLEYFFHEDFTTVREIIQNKKYVFFNNLLLKKAKEKGEHLKPFLSEFFFDDLLDYARRCIDENHYRALYAFLQIRSILDEEIVDVIRKKMEQRFLFLSETFRLHRSKKLDKVFPLMNPFFFRCINQLNRDAVFEDRIMSFQNFIIDRDNEVTSRIFVRLIFSLTHYLPFGEKNKEITQHNHRYSISEGAYESKDRLKNPNFKGGSACSFNEKSSFNFQSLSILIIPAVIVFFIILKHSTSSSEKNRFTANDFVIERIKDAQPKNASNPIWENIEKTDLFLQYLPNSETIEYLQYGNPEITERIPLNKERNYYFNDSPFENSKGVDYLQFSNITSNPIILIMQNKNRDSTYLFLRPLQVTEVSFELSKLTVYTGEELQEVVYRDERDSSTHGLRFNKFEASHKASLQKTYTFKNINNTKFHKVHIVTNKRNKTGIKVRHDMTKYFPG